jgi:hypothetical protein
VSGSTRMFDPSYVIHQNPSDFLDRLKLPTRDPSADRASAKRDCVLPGKVFNEPAFVSEMVPLAAVVGR